MSLMQQALNTYNFAEKDYAGVYFADAKEPLAPVGHTITKAAIEIVLNADGEYIGASSVIKGEEKTVFPSTEKSAGRSGTKPVPHPLCEQIKYLLPINEAKYCLYVKQLSDWATSDFSHPIIRAVLKYVEKGTLYHDLENAGLLKKDSKDNLKNEDDVVRWVVNGIGEEAACWKNQKLHKAYLEWYQSLQSDLFDYCMITGEFSAPAKQHAKGVVSLNGNAKIISTNDGSGFTYRGRFISDYEALNISYEASQKAHNALRWIVANQGVYIGSRCFVCWNPQGKKIPKVTGILARRKDNIKKSYEPSDYKNNLRSTLSNWKSEFPNGENVVTAVFDAATTGRLSIAYYSDMRAIDYIDRLGYWEETCCWLNGELGIQSPPLEKIADYAYGTLRTTGFETDDSVKKQVMMQLLSCRLEKTLFQTSIERALVQKVGNLQIIPDDREHKYLRRDVLSVACAVIRKYYIDHFMEEWEMALEPGKRDRSYQFGRLMAIMEKIEKDTYDGDEKRETNIIRRQQAFISRPYTVTTSVIGHLKNAYYPQLSMGSRNYYEKQIEEIMEILSNDEMAINKPLKETYLLGYYLQKKELYTSKKELEEE